MLEDQISQSEFFYEKICLVLFSQTNFDCMWEKRERCEESYFYLEEKLENMRNNTVMAMGRRIE